MKEKFSTTELKRWFKGQGITQFDIADRLKVSQGTVSALLNGRPFGAKSAHDWSIAFGLSEPWLLRREGPMLKDDAATQVINGGQNQNFSNTGTVTSGIPVEVHQQTLAQLDKSQAQLDKSQEQIDRLISVIEAMQKPAKK